jgi:hypothetical protein
MSFKTKLAIYLAQVVLYAWVGFPEFGVCRDNGGGLLSCGLVGLLAGLIKVVLFLYLLLLSLLMDGVAHLFGKS